MENTVSKVLRRDIKIKRYVWICRGCDVVLCAVPDKICAPFYEECDLYVKKWTKKKHEKRAVQVVRIGCTNWSIASMYILILTGRLRMCVLRPRHVWADVDILI